jgi:MFS family permease
MEDVETNLALSIFVFAFAVGPLVMNPLSEVYGRRPISLCGSIWYSIWNAVCALAYTKPLMFVARLLGGFGASGEYAVFAS